MVESFVRTSSGQLFAGTSGGYLQQIDLVAQRTHVLGKPRLHRRVRAMGVGLDDPVYLVCGETDIVSKIYRHDPKEGFRNLGSMLNPPPAPCV